VLVFDLPQDHLSTQDVDYPSFDPTVDILREVERVDASERVYDSHPGRLDESRPVFVPSAFHTTTKISDFATHKRQERHLLSERHDGDTGMPMMQSSWGAITGM